MSDESQPRISLDLPRRSTELEDSGTRGLELSDGDEDHFSDAPEDRPARTPIRSGQSSPIPRTRIEKIDDEPSHGQIPGTAAFEMRKQDAIPDEIEIVTRSRSTSKAERPVTPGGSPIPRTVVEMVDPSSPSHGDVPGTEAYEKRKADATPDLVRRISDAGSKSPEYFSGARSPITVPIPKTVITRVDSEPAHGEVEGTSAQQKRQMDATPDVLNQEDDVPSSPTSAFPRSENRSHVRRKSTLNTSATGGKEESDEEGFGDDFDDFEEGEPGAADDFGDFDDGFEDPSYAEEVEPTTPTPVTPLPSYPLVDFKEIQSVSELLSATQIHLDAMFPNTTDLISLPKPDPIPDSSPIFPSDRSRSLWKQLVTPPPLQPPNWTKSRIRRLFLVSLGVPVDLDEILPPSKQKKLVLPDINLESSRKSESDKAVGSVARLKKEANDSSASVDSQRSSSKPRRKGGRKGPDPPPELDLTAVKRLCATTNEKLDGFTDDELKEHVAQLEEVAARTSEVLEYWLKRRDVARAEKEAFEGVIENLVRHARRVRK